MESQLNSYILLLYIQMKGGGIQRAEDLFDMLAPEDHQQCRDLIEYELEQGYLERSFARICLSNKGKSYLVRELNMIQSKAMTSGWTSSGSSWE